MKRRTFLKGGAAALGVGGARPSVVLGQAKPFAGVTINGACFQHVYQTYLQAYIPEFEEKTGMKVNFTLQAFPVYNQRADLEAALQMLPAEYVEAARIDGANPWQLTRHIVLPFLRGVLLVAGLFRLIDSIKAFPLIFIFTDGGPGSVTEVTNYYSYQQAFNFSYLGYSSAITMVLVAATVALSAFVIRAVGWRTPGE
jgi:ABC-type sulfate transport system permease component